MKKLLSSALVLAVLTAGTASRADTPAPSATSEPKVNSDQKAAAQVLFDKARELVLQKNFGEACPKLAESLRLDPGIGTMLWLADCYENNGQSASAWAVFKEAASVAALKQDPREAVARRRVAAIEPKLTYVAIALPPGANLPGLEVRRDGVPVSSADPVPVDPGVHAFSASAPAHKSWNATVDVSGGRTEPLVVNVPVLAPADAAPAAAPAADGQPVAPVPVTSSSSWSTRRILGVSVAAIRVVGLGVGTAFGLGAKSALDDSNKDGHCLPDNQCDATGKERRSDASSHATVSTIAFVAGGAALVAGAVLFFTASPDTKKSAFVFVPAVSGQEAGAVLWRRF